MRKLNQLLILLMLLNGYQALAQCVNPALIDSTVACITIYDPVCGCNGETYSNACIAQNYGGVTNYTPGICNASLVQCCQAFFTYEVISGIAGYTVTFDNLSSGCFVAQLWDFGNGDTSNAFEPSYTYLASQMPADGKVLVCLTVYNLPDSCYDKICGIVNLYKDQYACVDSSLIDMDGLCPGVVDPVCACNGIQYDNDCIALNYNGVTSWYAGACPATGTCQAQFEYDLGPSVLGFQATFTETSNLPNVTYLWDFGDGTSNSTQREPSHTYLVPGVYAACLKVTDTLTNCTSTFCRVIRARYYTCIDSSQIDSLAICPGVVDPVCGCNGVTYGNSCLATAAGVQYWRRGACGTEQCFAYFTFTVNDTTGEVSFSNQSSDNTFLSWDFGDTTSNLQNPTHVFATPGAYPVCLSLASGSCTAIFCDTVVVGTVGVGEVLIPTSLSVYPNPFNTEVYISMEHSPADAKLWITDLAGRVVTQLEIGKADGKILTWNAEGQPSGYYLLHYQSGQQRLVEKLLLLR